MLVRATKLGYYGVLREEDTVFEIESEEHFSERWMVKADVKPDPKVEAESVRTDPKLPVSGMGVTVAEAVKIAMENGDVSAAGIPLVSKLSELTGRKVTADERDEVLSGGINQ